MSDGAGGAIIAWQDRRSGAATANNDIYAQRLDASGAPQWAANGVVVSAATGGQLLPVIASDGASGAIVAWADQRSDAGDVYGQRVSGLGVAQWTTDGTAVSTEPNAESNVRIVTDGRSGAIVAWQDARLALSVYAQRIDDTGALQWAAGGVGVSAASGQPQAPALVADGANGAVIGWGDDRASAGVALAYGQRFDVAGNAQWAANGVLISSYPSAVAAFAPAGRGDMFFVGRAERKTQGFFAQLVSGNGRQ